MEKHEWKKKEKEFYQPRTKPVLIDIPEFQFASLEGEGNPNSAFFADCITVLYSMSYALKMNLKKSEEKPRGYIDYTVYPLEGIWDLKEEAKKNKNEVLNKDDLVFNIMIRQPNFVSKAFFQEMLDLTKKKKPHVLLDRVKLENITDGKCVQMMHIGSFDDEPASFKLMEEFAKENGVQRIGKNHREIYLSDFRRVSPEKLKTVLRFRVK